LGNLLFSSEGRINAQEFLKGAIILLAFNFFLWPSWLVHSALGFLGMMLAIGSIYCWWCLFAKRLRDAGQPGGWFALFFGLFVFLAGLITMLVVMFRTASVVANDPELMAQMEAMQSMDQANPTPEEMEQVFAFYAIMGEVSIIPAAIVFFVVGGGIALTANMALKSKLPDQFN